MNGIAVLVSLAVISVDYGWQPASDGQLEYIIQIEPALLEGLKNGDEIASEIVPEARGVRKFRIRVGSGPVPKIGHLQNSTVPRSLTTPAPYNSRGESGSSVLPPMNDMGSSSLPSSSGGNSNEFRPDGFLNLPPPPALLGIDGKSSILVRPSGSATGSQPYGDRGNPPSNFTNSLQDLAPPPVASDLSSGAWQPPGITGPDNSIPPGGGVFPPRIDDGSSPADNGNMVLPPNDERPVRPIPSPSPDSDAPDPIRFGQSGIRPPAAGDTAMHGNTRPASSSQDRAGSTKDTSNLLASASDADAAALKPTIDAETAEQLEAKPWTPLVLTSLALFASLAANFYLGWIAVGIYRRYQDMVGQLHQAQASLT